MKSLPSWNNDCEYPSLNSFGFQEDFSMAQKEIESIKNILSFFDGKESKESLEKLQSVATLKDHSTTLIWNMMTYVGCVLAIDANDVEAKGKNVQLQSLMSSLNALSKEVDVFLVNCSEQFLEDYLKHPLVKEESFLWKERRKNKEIMLSIPEEKMLSALTTYGLNSWGDLYAQLSSSLSIENVGGAAKALILLRHADENLRKASWEGLQKSGSKNKELCASILNNMAGFRLEEYKKRSHTRSLSVLDLSLDRARISKETLDVMMKVVGDNKTLITRSLKAMAKLIKKDRLDSWDLTSPYPEPTREEISFEEAIEMVKSAFSQVDPKMGSFVDMMVKNNFIEARVLPGKRVGAYCATFAKSRTSRVCLSFGGTLKDVTTLAHELGHAYHNWTMRTLPLSVSRAPSTLSETASTFAEAALSEYLKNHENDNLRKKAIWNDVVSLIGFIASNPARFEFEQDFYEARKKGLVSSSHLSQMMEEAFKRWYGSELNSYESFHWMVKKHFYMPNICFYNFPYTFGYLFSLGVFSSKKNLGDDFISSYESLLQDMGKMTAEDLAWKHLQVNLKEEEFWVRSFNILEEKVALLEEVSET